MCGLTEPVWDAGQVSEGYCIAAKRPVSSSSTLACPVCVGLPGCDYRPLPARDGMVIVVRVSSVKQCMVKTRQNKTATSGYRDIGGGIDVKLTNCIFKYKFKE